MIAPAHRLHQLVEDLLELSRIEAQKQTFRRPHRGAPAHRSMIGLYALRRAAQVKLVAARATQFDALHRSPRAQADLSTCRQRRQYCPRRRGHPLPAAERDGGGTYRRRDTGSGMPSARLFERFYRPRSFARVSGTGLDFSIVKRLTEALGGHVKGRSARRGFDVHRSLSRARRQHAGSRPASKVITRCRPHTLAAISKPSCARLRAHLLRWCALRGACSSRSKPSSAVGRAHDRVVARPPHRPRRDGKR